MTLANYGQVGTTRGSTFVQQPGSFQSLRASPHPRQLPDLFAFRNPTVPLAGSLSMPFCTAGRPDRLGGSGIWANGTLGGSGTVANGTLSGSGTVANGALGGSGTATGALPGSGPLAAWTMGGTTQPERASRLGSGSADNMDDVHQWMRSLGLEPVSEDSGSFAGAEPRSAAVASGLNNT